MKLSHGRIIIIIMSTGLICHPNTSASA